MSVHSDIERIRTDMRLEGISPRTGLGEELFLFASTLIPLVNVDLLVMNGRGEFLLTWRDDPHCGRGWHIPGGCLRLGESLSQRIHRTAVSEFGLDVAHAARPAGVFEFIIADGREGIADQAERCHSVGLLYACRFAGGCIPKTATGELRVGEMKWFSEMPDDLIRVHDCYRNNWEETYTTAWRDYNGILDE